MTNKPSYIELTEKDGDPLFVKIDAIVSVHVTDKNNHLEEDEIMGSEIYIKLDCGTGIDLGFDKGQENMFRRNLKSIRELLGCPF